MRDLGTDVVAALAGNNIWPIFLLSIEIGDTTYYITDHYIQLVDNTNIYLPNGTLLNIGSLADTVDARNSSIDITLSGIDNAFRQDVLDADSIGGNVSIRRALVDPDTGLILGTPFTLYEGVIFSVSINEEASTQANTEKFDKSTFAITVDVRNKFYLLGDVTGRFTEDQSNRAVDENDASMEFVAALNGQTIRFGGSV